MKMKAVLSVLLLAALTGAATALFWRKYIHVNEQLNWTEAQAYCRENYVDLLTMETQEEKDNYRNYTQGNCSAGCWTGLSGNGQKMTFTQWSDGSLLTFTHWGKNEPSNTIDANCVYTNNHWHNDYCTNARTFICYTWEPELIVVQEMKTWEEALKYCRMNYTDLVSLDTERAHLLVNSKSSEILTPSFWTGLRFLDGSWFWVNQALTDEPGLGNLSLMPSCPAPRFRCGARKAKSNVLENRDCEEKMNFICYQLSIPENSGIVFL
ncbi:macrophage mannose receptor 1-like [Pangasianodon hypophthalmus]|uniref:macrophage mannose receptor 1-like n=1 Tax=Pangasianodon hypophthalmus TaxID=310915 RepID=UPI00230788FD|nr:macrophage mannose receptor 1-like [Pangasianodon hypophthalmus]